MDVKKSRIKRFTASILVISLIAVVVWGFIVADQNSQKVGFGSERTPIAFYTEPGSCYQLRFYFWGKESVLDFTEEYLTLKNIGTGIHQIVCSLADLF